MRCLDCKNRFIARTFAWSELRFARCPKCFRMDLSAWLTNSSKPNFWGQVKLVFGAHRWRCEYCRLNFVSLRRRSEVFSFKRWERFQQRAEQQRAEGSGLSPDMPQKNVQGSRHD
jgi:hypothetical protein